MLDGFTKWDKRFLELAELISSWSKDPSTKVGCVIVNDNRRILATGYNGFPYGVKDTEERLTNRDLKYEIVVHSEANAVAHAAREGISLKGATAYINYPPCCKCSSLLIQAGITRIVHAPRELRADWKKSVDLGKEITSEAWSTHSLLTIEDFNRLK